MLYVGIGMLVVGLLLVVGAWVTSNKAKRILAAPFRKTHEVASNPASADGSGMVSCEGTVKTQQPLTAPCSNQSCVYYHLKIEKKVRETKTGPQGVQTTTRWKDVSNQHYGSAFQLDDGSGPVTVLGQNELDADLQQTYSGPPPGGGPNQALGVLANMLGAALIGGAEQVLEYRATERIIGVNQNLFAMGRLAGGQIVKPDNGKLMVSTSGRDGLVGKTKRTAMILAAVGAVLGLGGVPIMIFQPGKIAECKALQDQQLKACAVKTALTDFEQPQQDGTKKMMKAQKATLTWEVTKKAEYKLEVFQTAKSGSSSPAVQAMIGPIPMNFGVNNPLFGGDSSTYFNTSTKNWLNSGGGLPPNTYTLDIWANKDGPTEFTIKITEVGPGAAGSTNPVGSAASAAPSMKSH